MEHFVTIFDSLFLPQGIGLYLSLRKRIAFKLWVLCVNDEAYEVLNRLALPEIVPLALKDFETEDLKNVKKNRSKGEYCWTLTPFAPKFVFQTDETVMRVTYLDADLFFLKDPLPLFREFEDSKKSVMITEHAYDPEYDQSASSGIFCVQWITYNRNGSEEIIDWWAEKCIEWCYARYDDNRFGDQKYLDQWPELFSDKVHVLQDKQFALAPWNVRIYPYTQAIFFHFQELRIVSSNRVNYGLHRAGYNIPRIILEKVYPPYLIVLREACKMLARVGYVSKPQRRYNSFSETIKSILRGVKRALLQLNTFYERSF